MVLKKNKKKILTLTNIESYYNAKFILNTDLNLYNDYIKNYLIKNKKLDLISNDSAISVINPYSLIHKKKQKFIRDNSQNNYLNNNYLKNNIYLFIGIEIIIFLNLIKS